MKSADGFQKTPLGEWPTLRSLEKLGARGRWSWTSRRQDSAGFVSNYPGANLPRTIRHFSLKAYTLPSAEPM